MAGTEPVHKVRLDRAKEAEERRLVEAAQRDRSRFADVYEEYFALVYAYTARRLRNRGEAEDLTAEVFRKALQSLPRFKWTGAPFAAWLFRIASNLIADRAKRAAREGSAEPAIAAELTPLSQPGPPQTQQTDLEECERRAGLFRLLGELAEDQQRVVIMRFTEDKSIREIANELDRSEGAVKQLQFRALQALRKRITEDTNKSMTER